MTTFTWARYADVGYEVSSRGDTRFSPLCTRMPDGRTIEAHYQCDVKGFNPGGENWRVWAAANPQLMRQLAHEAREFNGVLTDQFATTEINQARALCTLLNEPKTLTQRIDALQEIAREVRGL